MFAELTCQGREGRPATASGLANRVNSQAKTSNTLWFFGEKTNEKQTTQRQRPREAVKWPGLSCLMFPLTPPPFSLCVWPTSGSCVCVCVCVCTRPLDAQTVTRKAVDVSGASASPHNPASIKKEKEVHHQQIRYREKKSQQGEKKASQTRTLSTICQHSLAQHWRQ